VWLKNHNCLYADIELDLSILNQYPTDGSLPGFHERVVEDHILDAGRVFRSETAGFATHPAELLEVSHASLSNPADDELITLVEKMGVSDPECDKISGRTITASAVRNLVRPDLIVHHSANAVPEYNNSGLFPGMYPTLYPYRIGGFEDTSRLTPLPFERQAKYCLNISDRSFRYHELFIFVALNILQRQQAHLQTHFAVRKSNFNSVARNLTSVSPDVLQRLASRLEQECKLSNLDVDEWNALKLLHQVNTMSTRIPGSQASKIFVRNEI
jgi:hypothetical protein